MARDKILRLDQLRNSVAGQLEIEGKSHNVLQMTLGMQHDLGAKGEQDLRGVVQQVVPTIEATTIDLLNMDQVQAIIAFSGGGIELVEKLFPNVKSPGSETSPG